MSLALLLEKYDVSTEEGLQKALNEIEKEELEVDEALSGVLSRASTLEGHLRTASQAYSKLGAVKADTEAAVDMVEKTATLARDVSAKVRQLDLARSRVAECQRRVHDLIDLQLCSAGVEAAIKTHDYETGALHVSRYLSMDPRSVAAARARGAPDPRDVITSAAATLREHLVTKFEEAARKEDDASVEKLFKLFPQLGQPEEGVDLLAKYLATQMESRLGRLSRPDAHPDAAVYADALTRVLEAGGAALDRARRLSAAADVYGNLTRALRLMQPTISAGARRVANSLYVARGLPPSPSVGPPGPQPPRRAPPAPADPRAADQTAAELALAHSRINLYFNFVRRKTEVDASTLSQGGVAAALEAADKIINESDLMRTAQDLLAHYLALERYYVEESVNKALKLATPQPGVTTSSLVDDVFFIARKVIRRSLSTGSVDGACCVLNEVSTVLERDVAAALRRWLRALPPEPLCLPPPGPPAGPLATDLAGLLGQRLNRDVDAQRLLFLAHMNEAESGAEWAERLATEACAGAEPLYSHSQSVSDRDKVQSCATGLSSAAAAFRAAHEVALGGLQASLKPRINAWAEVLVDPTFDIDEMEDDADALPLALDSLQEQARNSLSAAATNQLLVAVLTDLVATAEARILVKNYQREGGLAVERRARRLAAWAGGAGGGAGREGCARLAGGGTLLALEELSHAAELSTALRNRRDAKDILARRTDFKIEDIKRLKL